MAITISFITEGEKLIPTSKPVIASGDRDTVTISVAFDSTWGGYAKSGVFMKKCDKYHNVYEAIMDSNNSCIIPHEALDEAGTTYIGIRGVNGAQVYTSSLVAYRIDPGAPEGTTSTVPPTASVYQQLLTANAVLSSRVDEIASLPEGGTSGDAELRDIRVKADGSTATTAGNAVREQVSSLSESIIELEDISVMKNTVMLTNFERGYYNSSTGVPGDSNSYARFTRRKIPKNADKIIIHLDGVSDTVRVQVIFWNDNNEVLGYRELNNDFVCDTYSGYDSIGVNVHYSDRREFTLPIDAVLRVEYMVDIDGGFIDEDDISDFVKSEYLDTTTGGYKTSKTFKRSRKRYRVKEKCFYKTDSNVTAYIIFYNDNMEFLGSCPMRAKSYRGINEVMSPVGSYYAYIDVNITSSDIERFKIYEMNSSNVGVIGYPFDNDYAVIEQAWCNASGEISSTANYNLIKLFNLPVGSKLYTSRDVLVQCVCVNNEGAVISNGGEYEQCSPIGRIYTIPEGTTHTYLNLSTSVDSVLNVPTDYAYVIKDNMKIAVIGDSITWLDGRRNYGGSNVMVGWQAQIRKKLNVQVDNYGYSGYPYAEYNGTNQSETGNETITESIYSEIVEKSVDMSGYDLVVLFGGANDVRLHHNDSTQCPIGNANTNYQTPNLNSYTMVGAIGGIVNYIRNSNPRAKILLCTTLPSAAVSRPYVENKQYRDAIVETGTFWSIPVIDLFSEINVSPTPNWSSSVTDNCGNFYTYFYDNTHPNIKGMERIGKLVVKNIEKYIE